MQDSDVITRARAGDRSAQDEIVRQTQDLIYSLGIRMLGSPADAEDATQEILVRILDNLESFRGESAFRTWAYRVAANYLLTARKRGAETRVASFDEMGEKLAAGLAAAAPELADPLVVHEAKMICTSMMLACLDREHRLAFILGEILELPGEEAAAVLEIEPDAYRKRVSRARERMGGFMEDRCGLVDPSHACRCGKQAAAAAARGAFDPATLVWPRVAGRGEAARARVADVDRIGRAVEVLRGPGRVAAPDSVVAGIRRALESGTSDLLTS